MAGLGRRSRGRPRAPLFSLLIALVTALVAVGIAAGAGVALPPGMAGADGAIATTAIADRESASAEIFVTDPNATVDALLQGGPRTPDSPALLAARQYLDQAYTDAGYTTEVQPFTYQAFQPLPSSLSVDGAVLRGNAIAGSPLGTITAPTAPLTTEGIDVAGAIAVVERDPDHLDQQVQQATTAGAVGLVVINPAGNWGTRLNQTATIPVLALSGEGSATLLVNPQPSATLEVQAIWRAQTGHNLIAHVPEATLPRLIVGAHYDSVPGSPGANDNASGTAAVLGVAQRLAHHPLAAWVWFVAFDAEELGLYGSEAFVASLPRFYSLKGMVNFELMGLNDQLIATGSPKLTDLAETLDPRWQVVEDLGPSDHYPFRDAGVPVIVLNRGLHPSLHQPWDDQVDPRLMAEAVEVAVPLVEEILEAIAADPAGSPFATDGAEEPVALHQFADFATAGFP